MILTNTQPQSGQVLIASPTEGQQGQTIKFVSSNSPNLSVGNSPTKTITFAQAQQMGFIPTTNKVQHILPSSAQKQTVKLIILLPC